MTPNPAAIVTIIAVDLVAGLLLAALVLGTARVLAPRLEAWCARRNNRFMKSFALSEDAALPETAKERARALFFSHLTARQRRDWHIRRRIQVMGSAGRRYTISPYRPFNVRTNDALYCLQVEGAIPVYDKLLAQKLLLECDEVRFLAHANERSFSPF